MSWATIKAILFVGLIIGWVAVAYPRRRHRRGRRILTEKQASLASRQNLETGGELNWGGKLLPKGAETGHFLVVGTTGSGKTLTIDSLAAQALPGIRAGSDHRALIYDSKQDVLAKLAGARLSCEYVTFNPFDTRSVAWDIARDVTAPATALQVATILIPEEAGNNRFFSDAARDLVTATMLSFIDRSPGRWRLADIVFGMRSKDRLAHLLSGTPHGRDLVDLYFEEERTLRNILATVRSRLAPYEPIAAMWTKADRSVSLNDWVNGEFVLVLASNEAVRTPLDAINRVVFKRATELVLAKEESSRRRTWFFLDEVREAGKLPGLSALLTKGRSKGACVVLGFQDIAGMKEAHGEHLANETVGQCSNKALLRLESGDTAEWAAKLVGEFEVIEVLSSVNTDWMRKNKTRSEQFRRTHAVMPSEFLTLPPTTMRSGLTGYYVTPHIGAFRSTMSLPDVLDRVLKERQGHPNFVARPDSQQYLEAWTSDDRKRLRIEEVLTITPDTESPARRKRLNLVKRPNPEVAA